jgi:hypothetical protein
MQNRGKDCLLQDHRGRKRRSTRARKTIKKTLKTIKNTAEASEREGFAEKLRERIRHVIADGVGNIDERRVLGWGWEMGMGWQERQARAEVRAEESACGEWNTCQMEEKQQREFLAAAVVPIQTTARLWLQRSKYTKMMVRKVECREQAAVFIQAQQRRRQAKQWLEAEEQTRREAKKREGKERSQRALKETENRARKDAKKKAKREAKTQAEQQAKKDVEEGAGRAGKGMQGNMAQETRANCPAAEMGVFIEIAITGSSSACRDVSAGTTEEESPLSLAKRRGEDEEHGGGEKNDLQLAPTDALRLAPADAVESQDVDEGSAPNEILVNASVRTQATVQMAEAEVNYHDLLTRIYQKHNPEKLRELEFVARTLRRYEGREHQLLAALKKKYRFEHVPTKAEIGEADRIRQKSIELAAGAEADVMLRYECTNSR